MKKKKNRKLVYNPTGWRLNKLDFYKTWDELNSGLPNTDLSNGREEDLTQDFGHALPQFRQLMRKTT